MMKFYPGIPDEQFERGIVPMTKEEIRAITLSKLRLEDGQVCVDMGSGTGSITVEMALQTPTGRVYAIETNREAYELTGRNVKKFGLTNVIVIHGKAPEDLDIKGSVDRVMIGGSKGNLEAMVVWMGEKLTEDGIVVGNFIVLENAVEFIRLLSNKGYESEVVHVSLAKGRSLGGITMMEGNNPIYIVTGKKAGRKENRI